MAEKRKDGTGQSKRERPTVRRRRTAGGTAGRIAVRRDTAAYRRAAMDEHTAQVRERIDAALAEGRRMREDIERRIESRLREEGGEETVGKLVTRLAKARLRAVKPELQAKGENRPRPSK